MMRRKAKQYLKPNMSNKLLPSRKSAISFWEFLGLGIILALMFGKF